MDKSSTSNWSVTTSNKMNQSGDSVKSRQYIDGRFRYSPISDDVTDTCSLSINSERISLFARSNKWKIFSNSKYCSHTLFRTIPLQAWQDYLDDAFLERKTSIESILIGHAVLVSNWMLDRMTISGHNMTDKLPYPSDLLINWFFRFLLPHAK